MAVVDELAPRYARVFAEPPYPEGPEDVRVFVRNYPEEPITPHRGRGVGREIMVRLLADRPEPWTTLAVHPDADAYRIYLRAGGGRCACPS